MQSSVDCEDIVAVDDLRDVVDDHLDGRDGQHRARVVEALEALARS